MAIQSLEHPVTLPGFALAESWIGSRCLSHRPGTLLRDEPVLGASRPLHPAATPQRFTNLLKRKGRGDVERSAWLRAAALVGSPVTVTGHQSDSELPPSKSKKASMLHPKPDLFHRDKVHLDFRQAKAFANASRLVEISCPTFIIHWSPIKTIEGPHDRTKYLKLKESLPIKINENHSFLWEKKKGMFHLTLGSISF